jgi:GntR family transcriptional regulator/MocR family aminotransferase
MVAPTALHSALRKARHVVDWHTEVPAQAAAASFIESGRLARYIRHMRIIYAARHHAVRAALAEHLGDLLIPLPTGAGLHIATFLMDPDSDDVAWAAQAAKSGVAVQPVSRFYVEGPSRPGMVFGYGAIPLDRIAAGVQRLRTCWEIR